MSGRRRAYLVTIRDFVVIADDDRDLREWVSEEVRDSFGALVLVPEELRKWGKTHPVGSWDPDRELTCAEIADEMERALVAPSPVTEPEKERM